MITYKGLIADLLLLMFSLALIGFYYSYSNNLRFWGLIGFAIIGFKWERFNF